MPRRLPLNEDTLLLLDILRGWKNVISDRLDGFEECQDFLKKQISTLQDELEDLKEQRRRNDRM